MWDASATARNLEKKLRVINEASEEEGTVDGAVLATLAMYNVPISSLLATMLAAAASKMMEGGENA